jgi:hypothetical protein
METRNPFGRFKMFSSVFALMGAGAALPSATLAGMHDAMSIVGAVGGPVTSWSGSVAGGAVYTPLGTAPTIGSKNGLRLGGDQQAEPPDLRRLPT